jgi:hypothetical protein
MLDLCFGSRRVPDRAVGYPRAVCKRAMELLRLMASVIPFLVCWLNGERVRMDLNFDKYKAQQFCDNMGCGEPGKIG